MIRPLRLEELEEAGRLAAAAFHDDPAWAHIFPAPEDRLRIMPPLLSLAYRLDLKAGHRINAFEEGGKLLGLCAYVEAGKHGPGVAAWLLNGWRLLPHFGSWVLRALELLNAIERLRPLRHHYLKMLTVDPSAQGKGVGAALISSVPTPLYLETFKPKNVQYYTNRGFKQLMEVRSEARPVFWTMLMKAPGQKA